MMARCADHKHTSQREFADLDLHYKQKPDKYLLEIKTTVASRGKPERNITLRLFLYFLHRKMSRNSNLLKLTMMI